MGPTLQQVRPITGAHIGAFMYMADNSLYVAMNGNPQVRPTNTSDQVKLNRTKADLLALDVVESVEVSDFDFIEMEVDTTGTITPDVMRVLVDHDMSVTGGCLSSNMQPFTVRPE